MRTPGTRFRSLLLLLLVTLVGVPAAGDHTGEPFEPFLVKHCGRCHGPEDEEGELRIDQLSRDFKSAADTHRWAEVLERGTPVRCLRIQSRARRRTRSRRLSRASTHG